MAAHSPNSRNGNGDDGLEFQAPNGEHQPADHDSGEGNDDRNVDTGHEGSLHYQRLLSDEEKDRRISVAARGPRYRFRPSAEVIVIDDDLNGATFANEATANSKEPMTIIDIQQQIFRDEEMPKTFRNPTQSTEDVGERVGEVFDLDAVQMVKQKTGVSSKTSAVLPPFAAVRAYEKPSPNGLNVNTPKEIPTVEISSEESSGSDEVATFAAPCGNHILNMDTSENKSEHTAVAACDVTENESKNLEISNRAIPTTSTIVNANVAQIDLVRDTSSDGGGFSIDRRCIMIPVAATPLTFPSVGEPGPGHYGICNTKQQIPDSDQAENGDAAPEKAGTSERVPKEIAVAISSPLRHSASGTISEVSRQRSENLKTSIAHPGDRTYVDPSTATQRDSASLPSHPHCSAVALTGIATTKSDIQSERKEHIASENNDSVNVAGVATDKINYSNSKPHDATATPARDSADSGYRDYKNMISESDFVMEKIDETVEDGSIEINEAKAPVRSEGDRQHVEDGWIEGAKKAENFNSVHDGREEPVAELVNGDREHCEIVRRSKGHGRTAFVEIEQIPSSTSENALTWEWETETPYTLLNDDCSDDEVSVDARDNYRRWRQQEEKEHALAIEKAKEDSDAVLLDSLMIEPSIYIKPGSPEEAETEPDSTIFNRDTGPFVNVSEPAYPSRKRLDAIVRFRKKRGREPAPTPVLAQPLSPPPQMKSAPFVLDFVEPKPSVFSVDRLAAIRRFHVKRNQASLVRVPDARPRQCYIGVWGLDKKYIPCLCAICTSHSKSPLESGLSVVKCREASNMNILVSDHQLGMFIDPE